MIAITGLGNADPKYQRHRHNLGFMIVDRLAEQIGRGEWRHTSQVLVQEGRTATEQVWLVKPQTLMNHSGRALRSFLNQQPVDLEGLWVVHDEADLALGRVKVKKGGGSSGHHGIESIDQALGRDYWRIRVGIGRDQRANDLARYVLQPFTESELPLLSAVIDQVANRLIEYLSKGIRSDNFHANQEKLPG